MLQRVTGSGHKEVMHYSTEATLFLPQSIKMSRHPVQGGAEHIEQVMQLHLAQHPVQETLLPSVMSNHHIL